MVRDRQLSVSRMKVQKTEIGEERLACVTLWASRTVQKRNIYRNFFLTFTMAWQAMRLSESPDLREEAREQANRPLSCRKQS